MLIVFKTPDPGTSQTCNIPIFNLWYNISSVTLKASIYYWILILLWNIRLTYISIFIRENYSALYNWLNGPIFREIKMAKPVCFSGCGLRARPRHGFVAFCFRFLGYFQSFLFWISKICTTINVILFTKLGDRTQFLHAESPSNYFPLCCSISCFSNWSAVELKV